jgi:signal transduction histidine kinase
MRAEHSHGSGSELGRLRFRLTLWYAATFCGILTLLGGGLFLVIRHQFSDELDDSLRSATAALARAAAIREMEASGARGKVVDAVDELHIPERELYLLDVTGRPVKPERADDWIRAAAVSTATAGQTDAEHEASRDRTLRLHAERFLLPSGAPLVAVAVADRVELEDRYASLIAAFGGAAIVAVMLVGFGGWLLIRQSTQPAERTIAYMRRFMADAAHELRTPLTVIRSRAEIALQQQREPAAYLAALRGIEAESRRLGRIVEDLLTLARADAGERATMRARVYLDDVAADAAQSAQVVATAKGVVVAMEQFEEAPVDGDADLLRRLVMILLDNAVKFTPSGGCVRLRVGTVDRCASVSVEDTGVGIAPADLPHVFERFYRADGARNRGPAADGAESGAGLGLSIARWIGDVHEAEVDLRSEVGVGTTVTVRFPRAAGEAAPVRPRAAGLSAPM